MRQQLYEVLIENQGNMGEKFFTYLVLADGFGEAKQKVYNYCDSVFKENNLLSENERRNILAKYNFKNIEFKGVVIVD